MMWSRYSRPSPSQTRQPEARVIRSISDSPAAPKSAAGRLLPVDVIPATRSTSAQLQHAERGGILAVAAEVDPAPSPAPHQLTRAALPLLLDPVDEEVEPDL